MKQCRVRSAQLNWSLVIIYHKCKSVNMVLNDLQLVTSPRSSFPPWLITMIWKWWVWTARTLVLQRKSRLKQLLIVCIGRGFLLLLLLSKPNSPTNGLFLNTMSMIVILMTMAKLTLKALLLSHASMVTLTLTSWLGTTSITAKSVKTIQTVTKRWRSTKFLRSWLSNSNDSHKSRVVKEVPAEEASLTLLMHKSLARRRLMIRLAILLKALIFVPTLSLSRTSQSLSYTICTVCRIISEAWTVVTTLPTSRTSAITIGTTWMTAVAHKCPAPSPKSSQVLHTYSSIASEIESQIASWRKSI